MYLTLRTIRELLIKILTLCLFNQTTSIAAAPPVQQQSEDSIDPMDVLRQTIFSLTEDPAGYTETVADLVYTLTNSLHDEQGLVAVVEELFNQVDTLFKLN